MRKKSAFLEKLTARAAAAFEGSSSLGADTNQSNQSHDSTLPISMPENGLEAHEVAASDTSADKTQTTLESAAQLYTETHNEQVTSLAEDGRALDFDACAKNVSQEEQLETPESQEVAEPQDILPPPDAEDLSEHNPILLNAGLNTELGTEVGTEVGTELSTQLNTEGHAEISTEQGTEPDEHAHICAMSLTPASSLDSDEERTCASLGYVAKALFAHLITMEKNVLNMKKLHLYNQNKARIPYTSIRTAWARLKALRIISHSARHDIGNEKGVLFQLDGIYTFAFQKLYPHMLGGVGTQLSTQQGTEQGTEVHTQLSTELNTGLSTQVQPHCDLQPKTKLEVHPDYSFWREYGLSQTQCEHWKNEFGLDDLLLDNYLRWCAYDIGHGERKDKSGKTISNPANWFYSILKKTGSYPKPEGYQSHEEKIFIIRENLLQEQASLQARQNALRAQEEKQEAEALFIAFLEEGDTSPHYEALCQKVSPFLYENRHTRRRLFENALRAEYFAFLGITVDA